VKAWGWIKLAQKSVQWLSVSEDRTCSTKSVVGVRDYLKASIRTQFGNRTAAVKLILKAYTVGDGPSHVHPN
jgi:hypothetical protein